METFSIILLLQNNIVGNVIVDGLDVLHVGHMQYHQHHQEI